MVTALARPRLAHRAPRVIEIVGLAGAGKTTLVQALRKREPGWVVSAELAARNPRHLPIIVRHLPGVLPLVLRPPKVGRRLGWEEIKLILYLAGWPGHLRRTARPEQIVLLDQGPLYKLATLRGFGPAWLHGEAMVGWRRGLYRQWGDMLSLVVDLDAPEAVLAERIHTREKGHVMKGQPAAAVSRYLDTYRGAFEQELAGLAACGPLVRLAFDTSRVAADAIAAEILAAIGSVPIEAWQRGSSHARIYSHQQNRR